MHFELSEELKALAQLAKAFAAEKIRPFVDQWEREHYFAYREVVKRMAELGFPLPILRYRSAELKRKYIPTLVNADSLGGFASTEPTAGSDDTSMKSRA